VGNFNPGKSPPGKSRSKLPGECQCYFLVRRRDTLQGINISHLGKRKIIFKMPFLGDMLVSWRVLP